MGTENYGARPVLGGASEASRKSPTASKALPSQDELHALLKYNPNTGVLLWKTRPVSMFDGPHAERMAATWNFRWAGKPALATIRPTGHLYGSINVSKFSAHRVIWKMVHGEDPIEIDHINGDPGDNRFANLRSVTHTENGRNVKLSRSSTSGRTGVSMHQCGKWSSRIQVDGRSLYLGLFADFEAASAAREAAEKRYGFHPNHGRAAA